MTDQPATQRPWSTVDDEELRHLRHIAALIMALQIGPGEVCDVPPHLLRIALHEAIDCYATQLLDGTAPDTLSDFGFYLKRAADRDNAERDQPPAWSGTSEELLQYLESLKESEEQNN